MRYQNRKQEELQRKEVTKNWVEQTAIKSDSTESDYPHFNLGLIKTESEIEFGENFSELTAFNQQPEVENVDEPTNRKRKQQVREILNHRTDFHMS